MEIRNILAATLYLIIGGQSCMGAFPYEYNEFSFVFKKENVEEYLDSP